MLRNAARDRSLNRPHATGQDGHGIAPPTTGSPGTADLTATDAVLNAAPTVHALAETAQTLSGGVRTSSPSGPGGQYPIQGIAPPAPDDLRDSDAHPVTGGETAMPGRQVSDGHDVLPRAEALIAGGRTAEVRALLLEIQRTRAANGPPTGSSNGADADERAAEYRCLRYLQSTAEAPGRSNAVASSAEQKVRAGSLRTYEGQIAKVSATFSSAMATAAQHGQGAWGTSQEALVIDALRLATSALLFFNHSANEYLPKVHLPAPDALMSIADLARDREIMIQSFIADAPAHQDHYDHAFERLDNQPATDDEKERNAFVDAHPDGPGILAERKAISARKHADNWLKAATPYVELKLAFLGGWNAHDYGDVEQRGFYYLLTRTPKQAKHEMAGHTDAQAGSYDPASGKIALARALQEAFSSAACHEDAIAFTKYLGSHVYASGVLTEREGGMAVLDAMKAVLLAQLTGRKAPMVGLRLRDSGHHSVVLLFEHAAEVGLVGTRFETVAGRDTEQVLYFMDKLPPLSAAEHVIGAGLEKVLQTSRPGWSLEWEAFEVMDADALPRNLAERSDDTLGAIRDGLKAHRGAVAQINRLNWDEDEDGPPPWITRADDHVADLEKLRPAYLGAKQHKAAASPFLAQIRQRGIDREAASYRQQLRETARAGGDLKTLLERIAAEIGPTPMYSVASAVLSHARIEELVSDLL